VEASLPITIALSSKLTTDRLESAWKAACDGRQTEQTTKAKRDNDPGGSLIQGAQLKQSCPDYLGPWPVSLGENAQTYESFLSEMVNYYNPSDPIEWIRVRDIADSQWQLQRMQRAIATIIDLAKVHALEKLLMSWRSDLLMSARSYAEGYFQHCPRYRPLVLKLLEEAGLTEHAFASAAVAMRAAEIDRMERSAMLHQACRDEAFRNLERHCANKVGEARGKPPVQDAEYRVIEDNSKDQKEAA
jgi:hypothetical protein